MRNKTETQPIATITKNSKKLPFTTPSIEIKDVNSDKIGTYHEIFLKN